MFVYRGSISALVVGAEGTVVAEGSLNRSLLNALWV